MLNRCFMGDTREGMLRFIQEGHRVQTVVTSPPYWALRDYGVEGQLGLEQTPSEYLRSMVGVFRLVRELMADDGTLWLNMGDSYAGSRCGGDGDGTLEGSRDSQEQAKLAKRTQSRRRDNAEIPRSDVKVIGLKPKDMVGMPWRLAFALQEDGWYLRSDIIWSKPNPMPESVRDRPTKSHEYLFLLSKSERYFYDAEAIKEPTSDDTHARYARGRSENHKYADGGPGNQTIAKGFEHMRKPVGGWDTGPGNHSTIEHASPKYQGAGEEHRTKQGLAESERKFRPRVKDDEASARMGRGPGWRNNGVGFGHGYDENVKPRVKSEGTFNEETPHILALRNKRTVWSIPTEPFSEAHFATFPRALVEPCVLAGSRTGDIVFDPFMGSGTVGAVAASLGRSWLGCELNPDYGRMQEKRTAQAGLSL